MGEIGTGKMYMHVGLLPSQRLLDYGVTQNATFSDIYIPIHFDVDLSSQCEHRISALRPTVFG